MFSFCPYYRDEDAPKMITDPDAVKPDGWLDDGPESIPDPDASKPDDWLVAQPIRLNVIYYV